MAEQNKDQRTHEATPQKKERMRREGKFPQSADIGAAGGLFTATLAFALLWGSLTEGIMEMAVRGFRLQDRGAPGQALIALGGTLSKSLFPMLFILSAAALAAGLFQSRGLFAPHLVLPKLERLDPLPKLKRLLPGKETAIEIGKQILKVALLGIVVVMILRQALPSFSTLAYVSPKVAAASAASTVLRLAFFVSASFALVAVLDYWLAKRKFNEEAKMTFQELKEERKGEDGNPQVKRKMRQRMQEAAARRAVSDVKHATVLVTNPTHISIALRYKPGLDAAPMLLGKGVDDVAMQMRSRARMHGVPIVENRGLARALHSQGKNGKPIPIELYGPCAEVIAHVMRLRPHGSQTQGGERV